MRRLRADAHRRDSATSGGVIRLRQQLKSGRPHAGGPKSESELTGNFAVNTGNSGWEPVFTVSKNTKSEVYFAVSRQENVGVRSATYTLL